MRICWTAIIVQTGPDALLLRPLHHRVSVADLIAIRNLQRKPTGIELEKLNKGLRKKKKAANKKKGDGGPKTEEDRWKEQMERGGLVQPGAMKGKDEEDDDDEEGGGGASKARNRLARQDNFQGETNAIDVDKHMMAYIEEEMRKRRGGDGADGSGAADEAARQQARAVLSNPEDELYKVAEKYTRLQQEARSAAQAQKLLSSRSRPDDEEGEGSVGLSSAMLSGIPEVELGMDSRLKNIEDTERAKKAMLEARAQRPRRNGDEEGDDMLAKARFFAPKNQTRSDAQALAEARAEATGEPLPSQTASGSAGQKRERGDDRKQMASDEIVMQRFKKRQMNQMKR